MLYNTEVLLESYLFPDGKAKLKYSMLTEAEKVHFTKSMVAKLFETVKNKALKVNYAGLEKIKGDITKYPRYSDIENSIKILNNMYHSAPEDAPQEILSCVRVLDILKKNKNGFVAAYNGKNDAVELLFVNVAAALIIGTSKLVAVTVEYIKQPNGSYKAIFKENSKTLMKDDTYFLTLSRFITMDKNGQLKQLLDLTKTLKEELDIVVVKGNSFISLNEDDSTTTAEDEDFSLMKLFFKLLFPDKDKNGKKENQSIKVIWKSLPKAGKAAVIVGGVVIVIWAVASLPYIIYRLRKTLSDHLLNLAYFLEEHTYEIDASTDKGKDAKEKQLRLVEKLKALGTAISLDDKQAKKQGESDKKDDEEESRKSDESDESSDDGDILL